MIFEEREVLGRDFKIYGDKDNPLFLAKDVASWIEHSKVSMMLQSVDEDEKVKVNNVYFGDFKSGKIIFDEIEESIKINETTYNLYTNNSEDY